MTNNGNGHVKVSPDTPEGLSDEEQHLWIYQQNCQTVASAIEDLHHRNLARMTLLGTNHHVEINPHDLLAMKFEILLDLCVGDNALLKLQVGFTFQQQLADRLTALEASTKET